MNTVRRVIKNILSLFLSGVTTQFIGFIAVIYLARVFGPHDFGKIAFATAIISYFMLLGDFGLSLLGTREVASDKRNINIYAINILSLRFILSIFSLIILLLFVLFINKSIDVKILIVLFGFGLIPSAFLLDWVFLGVERMECVGLGRILASIIYVMLIYFLVKGSEQLLIVPIVQISASFIAAIVLYFLFVKYYGKLTPSCDIVPLKKIFYQAMPLAFSLIMIRVLYNADTVILGFFRSYDEVGSYNAAYKIILLFIALAGVYHDAIFPLISKYYMESSESLKKLLYLSQKLMSCIGIFLAVYCSIVGKNIMNLVYGNRYNNSIIAFQILIWSVLIVYLNTTYSRGLLACRKENWYMLGVAIPALLNIIFNLTLIPKYGINGAAFSAVIAEISGFVIMYIGFKEICELPIVQITVKPLISSITMALLIKASIKWFDPNIYLLTFEAIISYIIILYLIGAFTEGEIENIKSIFVKRYKY